MTFAYRSSLKSVMILLVLSVAFLPALSSAGEKTSKDRLKERPWTTGYVYHMAYPDDGRDARVWTCFGTNEACGNLDSDKKVQEELTQLDQASTEERSADELLLRYDGIALFENASDQLKDQTRTILTNLADILREHPEVTLTVQGHTNNLPLRSERFSNNMELSEARANAARSFLIEQGIAAERLDAQGFGDSQPIASNDTEEGLRKNRRVDFVLNVGD